jgi:hypothetical protein
MVAPDPLGAGPDARGQPNVAGHVLRPGKARDVAELENQDDGDERTHARNGGEALDPGILAPALEELGIEPADLRIQQPWRDRLAAAVGRSLTRESPAFYYDVLHRLAARIDLWETEYYHLVDGPQAIVDWYRGTGLRPFLEALESAEQRQRFEKMILEGYARAYPRQRDGRVLFPFRRLFIVAHRPA